MKSIRPQESAFISLELPMPVIIHRQKDGSILQYNEQARKLFHLPKKNNGKLQINNLQTGTFGKALRPTRKFKDLGVIRHQTLSGKEVSLIVKRKSIHVGRVPCFVDLLDQPQSMSPSTEVETLRESLIKAKKEATDLQEKLNKVQAIASVGSWEMFGNFKEIQWSDEFYRIHGLAPQSIRPSTKARLAMVHPHDRIKLQQAIDGAVKNGRNYQIEKRIILPNGETRWVHSQGEVSVDEITKKRKIFGTIRDITERKNAELQRLADLEQLTKERIKFQSIIDSVDGIMWEADAESFQFRYVSEYAERILGYPVSDWTTKKDFWQGIIHPEDRNKTLKYCAECTRELRNHDFEYRLIANSGEIKWVHERVTIITENGLPILLRGIMVDITEQKEREKKLSLAEFTINAASDFIAWIKHDASFVHVTYNGHTSLGYTREEFLQLKVSDVDVNYSSEIWPTHWAELKKAKSLTFESAQKRKDGSLVEVEISANYIVFDGEEYNCAVVRNISDRKAEQRRLAATELINRLIVENSNEGILFTRTDGTILTANPEACRILDRTEEEIRQLGRDMLFDPTDPANIALVRSRSQYGFVRGEGTMIRKDGSRFPAEISSRIFTDPLNGTESATVIIRDLTARKQAESQRLELLDRFERIAEHIPGFIYQYHLRPDGSSYFPYASKGIVDIYGVTPKEVAEDASGVFSVIDRDDLPGVAESIRISAESMTEWRDEYRVNLPNGTQIWVEGFATPQKLQDGSILWHGYIRSISNRKRRESELMHNRQFLANLIDNLPGYVYRVNNDPDYTPLYLSETVSAITGCHADDYLIHKTASLGQKIHPADKGRVWELVQQALNLRQAYEFEYRIITKADEEKWVWERGKGIFNSKNELTYLEGFVTDITARKKAEQLLVDREANIRLLADNMQDMVCLHQVDGKYTYISPSVKVLLGYAPEELIGTDAYDLFHKDDREYIRSNCHEELLKGNSIYQCVYRVKKKDGSYTWFETQSKPIVNEAGSVSSLLTTSRDISKKKIAEEELANSEAKLHSFFQSTTDSVILVDRELNVSDFNKIATEYALNTIGKKIHKGQSMLELCAPGLEEPFKAAISQAFHGEFIRKEIEIKYLNGQQIWWLIQYIPVQNDRGEITLVAFNATNIDARKRLEQKLIALTDNIPDGLVFEFEVGPDGSNPRFNYVSQGAERMFEVTADQLMNDIRFGISFVHPDDKKNVFDEVLKSVTTLIPLDFDFRVVTPSGKTKWLRTRSRPHRKANGNVVIEGINLDVTHQKEMELELLRKADEVRAKNEMLTQLAENIPGGAIYQFLATPDGRFEIPFISEGVQMLTNLSSKEIMEDPLKLIGMIHPDDIGGFQKAVHHSAHTLTNFNQTCRFKTDANSILWLTAHSKPRLLSNGNVLWDGVMLDETARFAAQVEKEKISERFQMAAQAAVLGIWEWDLQTNEVVWDDACRKIFNEVDQTNTSRLGFFFQRVHPEDKGFLEQGIQNAIHNGVKFETVYRWIKTDGTTIYLEAFAITRYDKKGKPSSLAGLVMDVTKQKKAEQAIRESEQRFRSLADSAPVLIWMSGTDKLCDYFNQGWLNFTGRSMDQELGNGWVEGVHPDDLDRCWKIYSCHFDARESFEMEYRLRKHDGVYRWIADKGVPRYLPDGTFIGYIGTCFDIHETKIASQLLAESESRFKLGAQLANFGLYEWNITTQQTFFDDRAREIFQMAEMAESEIFDSWLKGIEANDLPRIQTAMDKTIQKGLPHELIYRWKNRENKIRVIHVNATAKTDSDGKTFAVMGIVKDITEETVAAERLRESQQQFQVLAREMGVGVILQNEKDEIIFNNQAALRMLGISGDQLLGKTSYHIDWRVIHEDGTPFRPDDRPSVSAVRLKKAISNIPMGVYRPESHDLVWLLTSATPLFDDQGNVRQVIVSMVDVTNEKKTQRELERLSMIARHTDNAILITDANRKVEWANEPFERITGYKLEEIRGRNPREFLQGPETDLSVNDFVREKLNRNESVNFEIVNYSKDGQKFWVEIEIQPVFNQLGVLTNFISIQLDITERKKAEFLIRQQAEEIQIKNDQLTHISGNIPSGAIYQLLMTPEGNFSFPYVSQGVEKILGVTATELMDDASSIFRWSNPDDIDSFQQAVRDSAFQLSLFHKTIRFEKDGITRWITGHSSPSKMNNGDVLWNGLLLEETERFEAETKLTESEARFRSLVEDISIGMILLDPNGRVLMTNEAALSILEMSKNELLDQPISNNVWGVVQEDGSDFIMSEFKTSIWFKEKKEIRGAVVGLLNKKSNQRVWVLVDAIPRFDSKGQMIDIICTLKDITALRQAQQSANANAERLKTISDNLPSVAIYQYELQPGQLSGRFTYYSEGVHKITGLTPTELLNDPNIFEERIHPEDKAEKDRFTMEAIKQAQEFIHEYRFQVKDHGWVWLRNRSKPSRQEDGGLIWNGVIIDITEQKTFEHELMIAKNRLELAAQAAGLGVWDADLTTGNILWDAGMARIYGIDPSENYLSKDRWTQFIHPDDLPLVEKQDHEMIHGDSNLYRGSFRIIREDNKEIRHVETLGIIDRDKNGRVLRMAGVNTDRTTERVYEQQLIQNVKEKEALIKEIHHRVKNNLQLISSILYLRLAGLADQEIKTFLQDTRQKIRSIALIHERLLQTGSVNLVDISDYLGKLISDMQTTIPPEGQRVNITYSIEPWQLGLDVAINCGLIVNELVTNSMKYAFNGRSNGQIEITFKKHLTGYEMIVADDGVGIPANVFPGKSESFGMQLLEIFTNQLRATCEIQRDKGTAFIIRFAPPGEN